MKIYQNFMLSSEISKLDMEISDACFAVLDKSWQMEGVRSVYTRLYYITKGEGYVFYRGKTVKLTPGNVYVIPAGLEFSYRCDNSLEKFYFHVRFLRDKKEDILSQIDSCVILKNKHKEIEALEEYWNESSLRLVVYVYELIYKTILEAVSSSGTDTYIESYSSFVKSVIGYIDGNLSARLTVSEIARNFNVSESYIHKHFKRETLISISRFISQKCLLAACEKLKLTDLSVKSISDSLGYCDQFYFSRKFTQFYGIPPTAYRNYSRQSDRK